MACQLKTTLRTILATPLILATITACTTSGPLPAAQVQARAQPTVTLAPEPAASATPLPTATSTPTGTATPSPTATAQPSATPTQTQTPTVTPTPTPLPAKALLEPMNHQAQTRNNCGPASIAILLGYYDHWITQGTVNNQLQAFPLPCNVARYISDSEYELMARAYRFPLSGERKLLPVRNLLANGIPVIVLQRLSADEKISHYRVIQGYDDAAGEFISDDPLLGTAYTIPYDTFASLLLFSRPTASLIPVYPPDMDSLVQASMRELGAFRWASNLCD